MLNTTPTLTQQFQSFQGNIDLSTKLNERYTNIKFNYRSGYREQANNCNTKLSLSLLALPIESNLLRIHSVSQFVKRIEWENCRNFLGKRQGNQKKVT